MVIEFQPIWFDSMGAKSSCTLVETPDTTVLIDPGCAEMQSSYPLPEEEKFALREEAFHQISKAAKEAEHIVISHYHHDHYLPVPDLYEGKRLWLKDPNCWINKSQWQRAREFISMLIKVRPRRNGEKSNPPLYYKEPEGELEFEDPLKQLEIAKSKDFGDYQQRREELLERGRERLDKLEQLWLRGPWIEERALSGLGIEFADGRTIEIGETRIRFTKPFFHGIEYANTGWVIAVVIEHGREKLIYSSDLEGPTIEDYAEWIIAEQPNYLILDGPSTYLLGYMLNRTNLNRAIANALKIVRGCEKLEVMLFDHHLLRDKKYRERTAEVWRESAKVVTAAELMGREPLLDQ